MACFIIFLWSAARSAVLTQCVLDKLALFHSQLSPQKSAGKLEKKVFSERILATQNEGEKDRAKSSSDLMNALNISNDQLELKTVSVSEVMLQSLTSTIAALPPQGLASLNKLCVPALVQAKVELNYAKAHCALLLTQPNEPGIKAFVSAKQITSSTWVDLFQIAAKRLSEAYAELPKTQTFYLPNPGQEKKEFANISKRNKEKMFELQKQFASRVSEIFTKHEKSLQKYLDLLNAQQLGLTLKEDQWVYRVKLLLYSLPTTSRANLVESIKDIVGQKKESLNEDPDSLFYHNLPDMISPYNDKPNYRLLLIRLGPICYPLLAERGFEAPIDTCKRIIAFVAQSQKPIICFSVLKESQKFMSDFQQVFSNAFSTITSSSQDAPNLVERELDLFCAKVIQKLSKFSNSESPSEIALYYDLGNYIESSKFKFFLDSKDPVTKLSKLLSKNFYSSSEVQKFINNISEEAEKFTSDANKHKRKELFDKLDAECKNRYTDKKANLCSTHTKSIKLDFLLSQRHGKLLAEYIVDQFSKVVDKYDIDASGSEELTQKIRAELEKYFGTLDEIFSDFDIPSSPFFELGIKKQKMLMILAFSIAEKRKLDLQNRVLPELKKLTEKDFEILKNKKIKTEEFQKLLENYENSFRISREFIRAFGMHLLSSAETNLIKASIHPALLIEKWENLSVEIRTELSKCSVSDSELLDLLNDCARIYGRKCKVSSPLALEPECPEGSEVHHSDRKCRSFCPEFLIAFEHEYCAKPQAVQRKTDQDCPIGWDDQSAVCIPQCPLGWVDLGRLCQRPVIASSPLYFLA